MSGAQRTAYLIKSPECTLMLMLYETVALKEQNFLSSLCYSFPFLFVHANSFAYEVINNKPCETDFTFIPTKLFEGKTLILSNISQLRNLLINCIPWMIMYTWRIFRFYIRNNGKEFPMNTMPMSQ